MGQRTKRLELDGGARAVRLSSTWGDESDQGRRGAGARGWRGRAAAGGAGPGGTCASGGGGGGGCVTASRDAPARCAQLRACCEDAASLAMLVPCPTRPVLFLQWLLVGVIPCRGGALPCSPRPLPAARREAGDGGIDDMFCVPVHRNFFWFQGKTRRSCFPRRRASSLSGAGRRHMLGPALSQPSRRCLLLLLLLPARAGEAPGGTRNLAGACDAVRHV